MWQGRVPKFGTPTRNAPILQQMEAIKIGVEWRNQIIPMENSHQKFNPKACKFNTNINPNTLICQLKTKI